MEHIQLPICNGENTISHDDGEDVGSACADPLPEAAMGVLQATGNSAVSGALAARGFEMHDFWAAG